MMITGSNLSPSSSRIVNARGSTDWESATRDSNVVKLVPRCFDLPSKIENLLNKIDDPRRMGSDHPDRFVGAQYCHWHGSVISCLNCRFD
jgi:hypothetical protein